MEHEFRSIICAHCGHQIDVPIYCGDRFCPICSKPRLARVRRRLTFLASASSCPRGYRFKMFTFTIRNQADLPEMIKALVRSFRKLRHRAFWKNHVAGGAFVIEVTGHPQDWHAHIHCIAISRYTPFETLLSQWMKVSPGRGVWISDIPMSKAVNYVTKYLSKNSHTIDPDNEIGFALRGYRLFQPFGDWYKLNSEFVDDRPGCPECGHHEFYPLDIFYQRIEKCAVKKRSP